MIYGLAFLLGIVAGLRAMTAPAAIAWAAWCGAFPLEGTWASFLASPWAVGILTLLALGEIYNDKQPATPSRKIPVQFTARIVMGAFAGAAFGAGHAMLVPGLVAGLAGAVIGTYAGAAARAALAKALGRDLPTALMEDVLAIGIAAAVIMCHP